MENKLLKDLALERHQKYLEQHQKSLKTSVKTKLDELQISISKIENKFPYGLQSQNTLSDERKKSEIHSIFKSYFQSPFVVATVINKNFIENFQFINIIEYKNHLKDISDQIGFLTSQIKVQNLFKSLLEKHHSLFQNVITDYQEHIQDFFVQKYMTQDYLMRPGYNNHLYSKLMKLYILTTELFKLISIIRDTLLIALKHELNTGCDFLEKVPYLNQTEMQALIPFLSEATELLYPDNKAVLLTDEKIKTSIAFSEAGLHHIPNCLWQIRTAPEFTLNTLKYFWEVMYVRAFFINKRSLHYLHTPNKHEPCRWISTEKFNFIDFKLQLLILLYLRSPATEENVDAAILCFEDWTLKEFIYKYQKTNSEVKKFLNFLETSCDKYPGFNSFYERLKAERFSTLLKETQGKEIQVATIDSRSQILFPQEIIDNITYIFCKDSISHDTPVYNFSQAHKLMLVSKAFHPSVFKLERLRLNNDPLNLFNFLLRTNQFGFTSQLLKRYEEKNCQFRLATTPTNNMANFTNLIVATIELKLEIGEKFNPLEKWNPPINTAKKLMLLMQNCRDFEKQKDRSILSELSDFTKNNLIADVFFETHSKEIPRNKKDTARICIAVLKLLTKNNFKVGNDNIEYAQTHIADFLEKNISSLYPQFYPELIKTLFEYLLLLLVANFCQKYTHEKIQKINFRTEIDRFLVILFNLYKVIYGKNLPDWTKEIQNPLVDLPKTPKLVDFFSELEKKFSIPFSKLKHFYQQKKKPDSLTQSLLKIYFFFAENICSYSKTKFIILTNRTHFYPQSSQTLEEDLKNIIYFSNGILSLEIHDSILNRVLPIHVDKILSCLECFSARINHKFMTVLSDPICKLQTRPLLLKLNQWCVSPTIDADPPDSAKSDDYQITINRINQLAATAIPLIPINIQNTNLGKEFSVLLKAYMDDKKLFKNTHHKICERILLLLEKLNPIQIEYLVLGLLHYLQSYTHSKKLKIRVDTLIQQFTLKINDSLCHFRDSICKFFYVCETGVEPKTDLLDILTLLKLTVDCYSAAAETPDLKVDSSTQRCYSYQ